MTTPGARRLPPRFREVERRERISSAGLMTTYSRPPAPGDAPADEQTESSMENDPQTHTERAPCAHRSPTRAIGSLRAFAPRGRRNSETSALRAARRIRRLPARFADVERIQSVMISACLSSGRRGDAESPPVIAASWPTAFLECLLAAATAASRPPHHRTHLREHLALAGVARFKGFSAFRSTPIFHENILSGCSERNWVT